MTRSVHTPGIFKAYDIRGVVPDSLDGEFAMQLGRAFGDIARREGERSVAVGRDGRLSSPTLADSLIRGLMASGLDVVELGAVTTPMLYFAANTLTRSGIQVTASHNPRDHNGFKLTLAGRTVHGDELQALRARIDTGVFASTADRAQDRRRRCARDAVAAIDHHLHLARELHLAPDTVDVRAKDIATLRASAISRATEDARLDT